MARSAQRSSLAQVARCCRVRAVDGRPRSAWRLPGEKAMVGWLEKPVAVTRASVWRALPLPRWTVRAERWVMSCRWILTCPSRIRSKKSVSKLSVPDWVPYLGCFLGQSCCCSTTKGGGGWGFYDPKAPATHTHAHTHQKGFASGCKTLKRGSVS